MPSARSRSVVGHRQHAVPERASAATSVSVTWVACTAVKRSPRAPCRSSSSTGVHAMDGGALLVLRRLLAHVGVERRATAGGPRADHRHRRRIDSSHRMDRGTDPDAGRRRQPLDPCRPRVGISVRESSLHVVRRDPEPSVEVAGVEQRQPDAGVGRRDPEHLPHHVRFVVGLAAHPVVQVVELAHARVAGQRHLRERRRGEREVPLRIERRRQLVHPLAPRPERTRRTMGTASKGAVEGVTVGVGEAGHGQPGEPLGTGRR